MLNAAIYIVFSILLIVCALLLLVVLMQRPKQEGLGAAFGAQMTDQAFGAQTTDVLKKGTVLFGTLFMGLCFVLAVLMNARFQRQKSELGQKGAPAAATAPAETPAPEAPAAAEPAPATETPAPAAPAAENLEDLLSAPAAPAPAEAPAEQPAA
ncbi:MAG: preprotein translocase subunit SecG [Akkermansia sp.]|nr:preprotein translocase subunit SecG [Akkermansia sp.]